MHDIAIRGGVVVDGTGAPGRPADIGISGGRVTAVGEVGLARRTIEADGQVVAPGFVDVHTHIDAQVCWDTTLSPSSLHGVTTMLAGNCGFTLAPINEHEADYLVRMLAIVEGMPLDALQAGVACTWTSTGEYLDHVDREVREYLSNRFASLDAAPPGVIRHLANDDAIVVADSGTNTTWWARHIPARRGQMHSVSGTLASMACGLPYALAAQLAFPQRQVVAFVGDGGYSMLMAELATAMRYELPIKVVVVVFPFVPVIATTRPRKNRDANSISPITSTPRRAA